MSQPLPVIYLLRHGETDWTSTGQHTGRTDLPLNARGESQAVALRASLAPLRFARVLCSPLQRARQTAALALPGAAAEADADLSEWDYGDYEGRTTAAIRHERPGWQMFRDGCPGGETLAAVGARADRLIGRIRAYSDNTVLVAHRDILRIVTARWLGLAPVVGGQLLLATASLSSLSYDHDLREPAIRRWNLDGNLD